MYKILSAHIKVIDEKNHVRFLNKDQVEIKVIEKKKSVSEKKPESKKESTTEKIVEKIKKKKSKK